MSDTPRTHSLRQAGLKRTPQRESLLRVLEEADRPLSAEEIRTRMDEGRSGLPTIYRNLERFTQEGWAEGLVGQDQVMRYVRCRSAHHHHHLQCEACGRTVEVEGCGVSQALKQMEAATGFRITGHRLHLTGLCPLCLAEKTR